MGGVLDEGADEVLGLSAGGPYEYLVAGLDEFHRRVGGCYFGLVFFFPVKVSHRSFSVLLATEFLTTDFTDFHPPIGEVSPKADEFLFSV
jgi:hypothetical protein